ncbi:hypothetical protein DPM19_04885 [Actinomadura craniellae]|uniref:Uncharacterized protein n=1 Tax=Actinomadura craniellae TaxID=2231787 RepID=A0A365HB51_9ACTN|nr:MCE family protein [Actinomadura craniellae]RAY16238.1 hypothetical protein DPM19_04885 [Actinomadura craniellae]
MRTAERIGAALLAALLIVPAAACSVPSGGAGGFRLTVYFAKTPALYEESRVKLMGADVGGIERIRTAGDRVRVDLRLDGDVPVPRDVRATIAAASAIGERSVILHPPWKPGMPRAVSGAVIPIERTEPAVEIDEALTAFTRLAESVDPGKISGLVHAGADLLDGNGKDVNHALATTARLSRDLAGEDERLVSLAGNLRDLSASLNRRDDRLTRLINGFGETSRMLADERTRLKNLLTALEAVIRQGDVLVVAYQEKLPETVARTSELLMTLKANSAAIAEAVAGLSRFTDLALNSWDRKNNVVAIRVQLNATLRIWLQPIFDLMGWGRVPCLDKPIGNCPPTIERRGRP